MTSTPEHVLDRLPPVYVEVLEAIRRGDTDATIAGRVGVDESAVPSLVRLAAVKLLDVARGRVAG